LICANESDIKNKKNSIYLDTVHIVIHFDIPEKTNDFLRRISMVKDCKMSLSLFTKYEEALYSDYMDVIL